MPRLQLAVIVILLTVCFPAGADDVPDAFWPAIQETFFADKTIQDGTALIRLQAPERAEDASLVPFSLQVVMPSGDLLKRIYLVTDANPIPLTAVFYLPPTIHQADISTRIRLDKNSYVRAIVETMDGRLFMQKIPIKTPGGGCGGGSGDDEARLRQQAGRMRLQINPPGTISFHIRHPMRTGFERTVMGYYAKAWFINRLDFSMDGHALLGIDVGPGISADPYLRFSYTATGQKAIEVQATDNEGKRFIQHYPVPAPNLAN